jgi:calcium-dependent protein kinase
MRIFEEMLTSLDQNCNGVIDYTEFLTAASNKEHLLSDTNLLFAFKMFDKDNSGTITKTELRAVFETGEKKDDELWHEIFAEVDLDKDGEITFEEFQSSMRKAIGEDNSKNITRS